SGQVVTVIEVLSPANKRSGEGRRSYMEKRDHVLGSQTNLVELDLLRAGERMPLLRPPAAGYRYSILVCPARQLPRAMLYPPRVPVAPPTLPAPPPLG